jgi:hypothetical protein
VIPHGGHMRARMLKSFAAAAALWAAGGGAVIAEDGPPATAVDRTSSESLMKKLQAMEQRIKALEAQLKQKQAAAPLSSASPPRGPNAPANPTGALAAAAASPAATPNGDKPILGVLDSPVPGLAIGAYGEIKFGAMQNPAANGRWQNGFDVHRLVLLPTYAITPNIIFNAEIEFEHGGSAFDADDKRHGAVTIEQLRQRSHQ